MRKFQRSITMLESLITKVERYAGVTNDAPNTLDEQMKEKYPPISTQAVVDKKELSDKAAATETSKQPEIAKPLETQPEKKDQQKPKKEKAPQPPKEQAQLETLQETKKTDAQAKDAKAEEKPKQEKQKKGANKKEEVPKAPVNETLEAFKNAELRVGQIEHCEPLPDSEKLYVSKVFMGTHHRTILSGLKKHVPLEGMSGKVVVFANLKPRQLAGQTSEGMLLCAETQDETFVELLRPKPDAKVGEIISLLGVEGSTLTEYKAPNSKALTAVLEKLNTNADKQARFGEYTLSVAGEPLQTTNVANGKIK